MAKLKEKTLNHRTIWRGLLSNLALTYTSYTTLHILGCEPWKEGFEPLLAIMKVTIFMCNSCEVLWRHFSTDLWLLHAYEFELICQKLGRLSCMEIHALLSLSLSPQVGIWEMALWVRGNGKNKDAKFSHSSCSERVTSKLSCIAWYM